ncbi:MAG: VOC family protein [Deltaproteobacteria bacterium]|nr:VOC family protein [Deltaproteobacteria bacterium]
MIKRIDHVAVAVRDLSRAKAFFLDGLGGRELSSNPWPGQKFRWTTLELGSSCLLELVDPLEEQGPLHRFLKRRGEGLHHVTFQVEDLAGFRQTLAGRGIPTFGFGEPFPGWKEMFVHPREACGVLLQFAEFRPLDWIAPGYIPPAYREFAPPEEAVEEEAPGDGLEVRRVKGAEEIEIRWGGRSLSLPKERVEELIQALQKGR